MLPECQVAPFSTSFNPSHTAYKQLLLCFLLPQLCRLLTLNYTSFTTCTTACHVPCMSADGIELNVALAMAF